MADDALIWNALSIAKKHLSIYLHDPPAHEVSNLKTLLNLIELSQSSVLQALDNYQRLTASISQWYGQRQTKGVNCHKALRLLGSINDVLRALETDCKKIIWPLSLKIPCTLYKDIEQLLLKGNKKEALLTHAKTLSDSKARAPLPPTTIDKLNHRLNAGIETLRTKRSVFAENKEAHQALIHEFKQLIKCFSKNNPDPMALFWEQYKQPEKFEALMTLLLITPNEKVAWQQSHSYFCPDKSKNATILKTIQHGVTSLYALGTAPFLGARLTPESLKHRIDQSIKQLYQEIIEPHQQNDDKASWLLQIEDTIMGAKINPLLHELILLQQVINTPQPHFNIAFESHSKQASVLAKKISLASQTKALSIKALRTQLNDLHSSIQAAQTSLRKRKLAHQIFIAHIQSIETLVKRVDFKLSNINSEELLTLVNQVNADLMASFLAKLPPAIAAKTKAEPEIIFQEFETYLTNQSGTITKMLNAFNHKGNSQRQKALEQLEKLIHKKHNLWEYLLRLFSSSYRRCMANIESTLRNDGSSLEKVDTITHLLEKTKQESSYFIRQRVMFFSKSDGCGMFMPEKIRNKKPNVETQSLAF